jgi:hypothetical protein
MKRDAETDFDGAQCDEGNRSSTISESNRCAFSRELGRIVGKYLADGCRNGTIVVVRCGHALYVTGVKVSYGW